MRLLFRKLFLKHFIIEFSFLFIDCNVWTSLINIKSTIKNEEKLCSKNDWTLKIRKESLERRKCVYFRLRQRQVPSLSDTRWSRNIPESKNRLGKLEMQHRRELTVHHSSEAFQLLVENSVEDSKNSETRKRLGD